MGIYKSCIFLTAHTSEIQPFLGLGDLSTTPRANSGQGREAQKSCGSELCRERGPAGAGTPAAPTPPKMPRFDKAVLARLLENSDSGGDFLESPFSAPRVQRGREVLLKCHNTVL